MKSASKQHASPARRRYGLPLLAALAVATVSMVATGCNNPYKIKWAQAPDTVILYSMALPASHLPNAFSFHQRTSYLVENPTSTGQWDVALDTEDSSLVLLPPRVLNIASGAAVAPVPGATFDNLTIAPKDTSLYVGDAPVPLQTGVVYAIRTATSLGVYGQICVYYAKMEPVTIDVAAGTLKFVFDDNPTCNDRRLIPPK